MRAASPISGLTATRPPGEVRFLLQGPAGSGGAAGIRTPDLRRAKAALSQLSYGPRCATTVSRPSRGGRARTRTWDLGLIRAALSPPELRARFPRRPPCGDPRWILPGTHDDHARCVRPSPVSKTKQVPSPSTPPCPARARPAPGLASVHRLASSPPRALLPARPPGVFPRSRSRSSVPRAMGLVSPTPDLGCCPGLFRPDHAGLPCP